MVCLFHDHALARQRSRMSAANSSIVLGTKSKSIMSVNSTDDPSRRLMYSRPLGYSNRPPVSSLHDRYHRG